MTHRVILTAFRPNAVWKKWNKERKNSFLNPLRWNGLSFPSFFLINTNGCLSEKYDKTRQNKGFDCKKTLQYLWESGCKIRLIIWWGVYKTKWRPRRKRTKNWQNWWKNTMQAYCAYARCTFHTTIICGLICTMRLYTVYGAVWVHFATTVRSGHGYTNCPSTPR